VDIGAHQLAQANAVAIPGAADGVIECGGELVNRGRWEAGWEGSRGIRCGRLPTKRRSQKSCGQSEDQGLAMHKGILQKMSEVVSTASIRKAGPWRVVASRSAVEKQAKG
jgi:hypothetical protein